MESNTKDMRELMVEIGKLHQQMLSLQKELEKIRKSDNKLYDGTDFAISNSKLEPSNINFIIN